MGGDVFGKRCMVLRFCRVKKRCRLGKGMEGERTRLLSFVSEWSLYCLCVSQVKHRVLDDGEILFRWSNAT